MITRTAQYAVRAVVFLAEARGETSVTGAQVAQGTGVPQNHLSKILNVLGQVGILDSKVRLGREFVGEERCGGGQRNPGKSLSGAEAVPLAERIQIGALVRDQEYFMVVMEKHPELADQSQFRGLRARPGPSRIEGFGSRRQTPPAARSIRPCLYRNMRGAPGELYARAAGEGPA